MKDESTTKVLNKEIINIENFEFTNKKAILNSPRSIESLRILGYDISDLYFMTFKEYIDIRVDLKSSGHEIQLKRYNHYEEKRRKKLNEVIEKRKELMKGDGELLNATTSKILKASKTTKNFSSYNVFSQDNNSTAVQQDKLKLEKLKQKEINDLQAIIDYEFQLEDIRENNRKKLEIQRIKEEKIKEEKMRKIMEENKKRKFKELEKQMRNKADEERTKKVLEEREELDRQKQNEERKKRERLEEDYRRKQLEQKMKDEEFKRQIEEIFISQQNKLIDRQKSMNEKDIYRKNLIERKKSEIVEKSKKKSESNQLKIERTIMKMENRLEQQRTDFEKKQVALEDTRKKFLTAKEEYKNYQNLLSKYKELEVKKILERNIENERFKVEKYNKKKDETQKKRLIKQEEEKRSLSEKHVANQLRQKRIVETISRFEKKKEDYRSSLIEKLNEINTRISVKKEDQKKGLITKFDNIAMAREDKYEKVMLYEKQQQYLREMMMDSINDRMKRIDEMKKQKNLIAEEKRRVVDDIKRKKKEMLEELEFKLHKGKLNKEEFYNKLTQTIGGSIGEKIINSSKNISKNGILETNQILEINDENITYLNKNFEKSDEISAINAEPLDDKNEEIEKNMTENDANMSFRSTENNESISKKKVSDYKSQLDHNLYDLITKCNIEENTLIKQIKNIENTVEKQEMEEKLILLKEANEKKIAKQKEKNKYLVAEYEKSLL